ncbi:MAG: hypothetical protein MW690_000420 [Methanophagales archaeon]|nr:hypothetical protein [Methanophagales archaeon]
MREKRAVRGRITAIAVIAIAFFAFSDVVTLAQPNIVELRDLIKVSVEPASIPADGVSTSRIEIAVFSPEMLGGGPAAHTEVYVSTDLGTLRDAENESNSGSEITLFTNDTAIAVALLSADEPGKANITVRAPSIEEAINLELGNESTVYIVINSTTITLLEPEVTPSPTEVTPSPTPPTPTPSLTPTPTPTPSLVPSPSPLTPSPTPSLPTTPTPPLPGTPYGDAYDFTFTNTNSNAFAKSNTKAIWL